MPIKQQHFIYHPDTGEQLEIRAVNQLKPDEILLGKGGDLTFGSRAYWEWEDFIAMTPGNERTFFRIRDALKGDKLEKYETEEDRLRELEETNRGNNVWTRRLQSWFQDNVIHGSRRLS